MYIILFFSILLLSFNLSANVMWPGLIWEATLFNSWHLILIGFLIELIIIKLGTNLDLKKSLIITFWMNLASLLLGIIFIPVFNLIEILLLMILPQNIQKYFYTEQFIIWLNIAILSVVINVIIETYVFLKKYPKFKRKKIILLTLIANALSAGITVFKLIPMK